MTFASRILPALLLLVPASLGLAPTAAQARNGENAALLAGALLGLAAGTTLTHAAERDEPPPRPAPPPRFADPMDEEDVPPPRFVAPRDRTFEGWYHRDARFRDDDRRPWPRDAWERYDED